MIGCIRCHGPTDDDGDCFMCDSRKITEKYLKAQGGDASCPGNQTQLSSAAPTFNPKGCGTVAWLIEELQKWPADTVVYVDWDYEGGNELPADTVAAFNRYGLRGIKIS